MAVLLTETYELLPSITTSNFNRLGWNITGTFSGLSIIDGPFIGSKALQGSSQPNKMKTLNPSGSNFYFGIYFRQVSMFTGGGYVGIRYGHSSQIRLYFGRELAGGYPEIARGATIIATATKPHALTTWNLYEVYGTIGSSGWCKLDINGENFIDFTGNTQASTISSSFNNFNISNVSSNGVKQFTQIIVKDDNTPIGRYRIETLRPNGAGDKTEFTPDSGNNWERVNENTIDGDTSYVGANTVGTTDLYEMGNVSNNPTNIFFVNAKSYSQQTDLSPLKIKNVIKVGATEYDQTEDMPDFADYSPIESPLISNPATSTAWTVSAVNTLQSGFKIS